mmetsp:Transcript_21859/g.31663  ORF Transcript_21859/g.31663 Transcript_21859/m.31663 type:complete len:91 (+) Transcript_21859:1551-1823(+)
MCSNSTHYVLLNPLTCVLLYHCADKLSLFGNFINDVIDTEDPLCVAVRSSMSTLAVDCNMVECACCCRFSNLRNCGCCDERDTCGDLGQR